MANAALDVLFEQAADAHRQGDIATTARLCEEIVAADPRHLRALFALAGIALDRGDFAIAESLAARVIAIEPQIAEAHNLRALALASLRRLTDAAESFAAAARLLPDPTDALYNRGNVLFDLGQFEEALACYDAALRRAEHDAVIHNNRGNALRELNRPAEALAAYERAITFEPDYGDAHTNRGIALQLLGRSPEALASFDRAIALPGSNQAEALYNRGIALSRLGRLPEALASHDRAGALNPDHAEAASLAFGLASILCDWRDRTRRETDLTKRIRAGQRVSPFTALSMVDDPELHALAAKPVAKAYASIAAHAAPCEMPTESSRLRLAYLSANLDNHAVAHTLVELFERSDRTRFELWGISLAPARDTPFRQRLKTAFDRFIDASSWSDAHIAAFLRQQSIAIAIDLMGYTDAGRPGIFARRAAPLQVNYFGYCNTLAADFIDYIVADRVIIAEDTRQHFTERIVYLPDAYLPCDTTRVLPDARPERRDFALPDRGFVFCNFNASYKIAPALFDIWMRLLAKVDDSVLWLYVPDGARDNLRREARARGVAPERLVFAPPVDHLAHLSRMRCADLFLDTLPYNAHSTATDALWAGLPLLTCTGRSFPARVATSVLRAAGVPELAAASLSAYETLALALATDRARLGTLRAKLAVQRDSCPLFDTDRFRRHLEAAYLAMWQRHRAGQAPASFAVAGSS